MEPDDPGRSPVSRQRRQASARGAVDQLDGVVAVRRREGPAVGGERGGDGRPGRRSKLAVGGGAVAERVGLRPRREGPIERRRVRVVLWGDARAERRVRASPRGAGVAAARGLAQPAGGIELARADLGKHRSPRPARSVRSAPPAFPSRPRLKKSPEASLFPPSAGRVAWEAPGASSASPGFRAAARRDGGHRMRDQSLDDSPACAGVSRPPPFDPSLRCRFVHLAGLFLDRLDSGCDRASLDVPSREFGQAEDKTLFPRATMSKLSSLSHVSYRAKLGFQRGHRPRRLLPEAVPLALAPARLRLDLVRLQPQPLLLRGVAAVHPFEGDDRLPVPLLRGDPGLATLPRGRHRALRPSRRALERARVGRCRPSCATRPNRI